MKKTTTESVLISTMINSGDPTAPAAYGITPEHLVGYRDEYTWTLDYFDRYGVMPTVDRLELRFPGFPHTPEESDARWPAHEIQEHYSHRQAMSAVVKASELLKLDQTAEAIAVLNAVTYEQQRNKPRSLLSDPGYLDDYTNRDEQRVNMPWATLQSLTNGIGPGELWYWAARPQHGKSSFLIDIATEAAWKGNKVMMISLEMTKRQCQVRFHAAMGRRLGWGVKIDAAKMLRREYFVDRYKKLLKEIGEAVPGTFDIHDNSDGFASPATVMRYANDYDLILVDYVGLMRLDNGTRAIDDWRCAATVSNGLKEAALAKNARILAASQINREGDTTGWRPPKLRHLAQSDAIGQDGDVVLTMKRYGRDAEVVSVEKNRHGPASKLFFTRYFPNLGDFTEIDRDTADDLRDSAPFEGE